MKNIKVAFVGMKRAPSSVPDGYWPTFVQFHLELPYYYSRYSNVDVDLTTTESIDYSQDFSFIGGGSIRCITEGQFLDPDFDELSQPYDVVIHWRKWFSEFYIPGARNVILCQDHSFSDKWKCDVEAAFSSGRLDGILVFPTWHKENTAKELNGIVDANHLYEGMTLGVDTSVYRPMVKDPFHLLWASDPGRGLGELIPVFLRLWAMDKRFKLTVTYPDYVKQDAVIPYQQFLQHPAVKHEPSLRNGSKLWNLFNTSGILPYSSTFPEPSSRCHRQAMAAASLVLYPPNMGTPSCLLDDGVNAIVRPIPLWPEIILDHVKSGKWKEIGCNARTFATSENWQMQAKRFSSFFSKDTK